MSKTTNNSTHIAFILDRSGSMSSIAKEIIGGFNVFLEDQKAVKGSCTVTLVQFDDQIDRLESFKPVAQIVPLTDKTYVPRGMTKLYDAIGLTVTTTQAEIEKLPSKIHPSKVLVVILTDGLENSSQEYTTERIKSLLEQQQLAGWQFTSIGANQDAILTAKGIGLNNAASNITFSASPIGTQSLMRSVSHATTKFRAGGQSATYCYSQADRDAQTGSPASFASSAQKAVYSESTIKAGRKGGAARMASTTQAQRSAIALQGAKAKWNKK